MPADPPSLVENLSDIGTVVAAVAAAISTWLSRKSADAARETVEQARLARRDEVLPRFVLERSFDVAEVTWDPESDTYQWPTYAGRTHYKSEVTKIGFSLENFGQAPAFEIRVIFEFLDQRRPFSLSDEVLVHGISYSNQPSHDGDDAHSLNYGNASGGVMGIPLFRRMRIDLPNLVPGKSRQIELPQQILNRVLARGLEPNLHQALSDKLLVYVEGYTVDGELVSTQFRYSLNYYRSPSLTNVKASAYFQNLPLFPEYSETKKALY